MRFAFALLIAALLSGCSTYTLAPSPSPAHTQSKLPSPSSAVPPNTQRSGGYYLDDGPGTNAPKDFSQIPDAVPKNEPLLAGPNKPYEVMGEVYFPDTSNLPFSEQGIGTWYGRKFHGKPTSSGELYDMYGMTGAHKTMPIPSYARVTDTKTGKSIIVKINDRGPFFPGRVIDLSYAAASKLGYASKGSTTVLVERVFPPKN